MCATLSGNAEPETTSSSLDNEYTSARKRYRRMFHRVMSGLERSGNVRLITLTSAPASGDFQKDFRKLIMRLGRRKLVQSYIRVPERTETGLRHDHILFRGSYIEQKYLSEQWAQIHGAPVVDIRSVRGRRGIANYLANYLAKSPAGRYSYSWTWVWKGFVKSWEGLKKFGWEIGASFEETLTCWRWCVKLRVKPEEVLPI
ncbi:hypothetical protein ES705_44451 [subsurface metagenome]